MQEHFLNFFLKVFLTTVTSHIHQTCTNSLCLTRWMWHVHDGLLLRLILSLFWQTNHEKTPSCSLLNCWSAFYCNSTIMLDLQNKLQCVLVSSIFQEVRKPEPGAEMHQSLFLKCLKRECTGLVFILMHSHTHRVLVQFVGSFYLQKCHSRVKSWSSSSCCWSADESRVSS